MVNQKNKIQSGANIAEVEASFNEYINQIHFPCVGAKAAIAKQNAFVKVTGSIGSAMHDAEILAAIYQFVDVYRKAVTGLYSITIIFPEYITKSEDEFENYVWQRLQALADLDAQQYAYDGRVSSDASSAAFSFSLKEEAFYIIGLHPNSSRAARQFKYPALTFNPHHQFVKLKQTGKYAALKHVIQKNEMLFNGSINPMLSDFGVASEAQQYTGKHYQNNMVCPLKMKHAKD